MSRRLVVFWQWLPDYRLVFFERVRTDLAAHGIELLVCTGETPPTIAARGDTVVAPWRIPLPTKWMRLGRRELPLSSVAQVVKATKPDMVIINHSLQYAPLLFRLKAAAMRSGFRLALWGHGVPYNAPHSPPVLWAKLRLARLVDWYFAYTQAGVEFLVRSGFPRNHTTALNNTLDTDELTTSLASVDTSSVDQFLHDHELVRGHTALFLGGVDDAKDFDFLAEVASEAARIDPAFRIVIAGSGGRLDDALQIEQDGGGFVVLGRVKAVEKARALKSADVLCIPSGVGLVAVDALFSGLGVLTRRNSTHGPEIDYMPTESIELLPAAAPARVYASRLVALAGDTNWKARAAEANALVASHFTLDEMVTRFVDGVLAWTSLHSQ